MPKEDYPGRAEGIMIRCPKCGLENWGPTVTSNRCAWCGYAEDPKRDLRANGIDNRPLDTAS